MGKNYRIRVLAFDPGISFAGWNLSIYNTKTKVMRVIKLGMLSPNKCLESAELHDDCVKYGNRIMTLDTLRGQVRELMAKCRPDLIVSEDAFYNPRRPSAYLALVQWLTSVDLLLHDEYGKVLFKISPSAAKQVISGFGGADKYGVRYAVLHKDDIEFKRKHMDDELTEHICDSIGIGYTFIHNVLPALQDIWEYNNVTEITSSQDDVDDEDE